MNNVPVLVEFFRDLKEISEKYLERLCTVEATNSIMSTSLDSGIDLIDLSTDVFHSPPVVKCPSIEKSTYQDIFDFTDFTAPQDIQIRFLEQNLDPESSVSTTSSAPSYSGDVFLIDQELEEQEKMVKKEALAKSEAEVATQKQENEALQQMRSKLKTMEEMVSHLQRKHCQEMEKGFKTIQELERRLNNLGNSHNVQSTPEGNISELIKQLVTATHDTDEADLKTRIEFVEKRTAGLAERFILDQAVIREMTDDMLRERHSTFKQSPGLISELEKEAFEVSKIKNRLQQKGVLFNAARIEIILNKVDEVKSQIQRTTSIIETQLQDRGLTLHATRVDNKITLPTFSGESSGMDIYTFIDEIQKTLTLKGIPLANRPSWIVSQLTDTAAQVIKDSFPKGQPTSDQIFKCLKSHFGDHSSILQSLMNKHKAAGPIPALGTKRWSDVGGIAAKHVVVMEESERLDQLFALGEVGEAFITSSHITFLEAFFPQQNLDKFPEDYFEKSAREKFEVIRVELKRLRNKGLKWKNHKEIEETTSFDWMNFYKNTPPPQAPFTKAVSFQKPLYSIYQDPEDTNWDHPNFKDEEFFGQEKENVEDEGEEIEVVDEEEDQEKYFPGNNVTMLAHSTLSQ